MPFKIGQASLKIFRPCATNGHCLSTGASGTTANHRSLAVPPPKQRRQSHSSSCACFGVDSAAAALGP